MQDDLSDSIDWLNSRPLAPLRVSDVTVMGRAVQTDHIIDHASS